MHRRFIMPLTVALALAGCDGSPDVDGPDGSTPGLDAGLPTGEASLSFTPTWGDAQRQFQGQVWQAILDLNVFQPAVADARDTRLVIMLCAPSDTTCQSPVLVREIASGETDGDPIQDNFGPDIVATNLPAGSYALMIVADTGISRSRGLAWDDDFETEETAWGGVVSELDVMLSGDATPGVTPAPEPVMITLTDGQTAELGTVTLQHVHERNISPPPNPEPGVMAVAVADGLRLVDTSTHAIIEAAPGFPTFRMVSTAGSTVGGTVCGMIDGPEDTVFLLYRDASVGAGFAIQFDVGAREQLHGGRRVEFPGEGMPCRGRYHDGRLYVTNATGSRLSREEAEAGEGLWVASLGGLSSGDVTARRLDRADAPILQHGVDDLALHGSTLYATIGGDSAIGGLPSACLTSYCVFRAALGGDGIPAFDPSAYWVGPSIGERYPTAMGDVTCLEEASPWGAITIAQHQDGRTLLFLGACLEIAVFDTSDGTELDLGAAPGTQGLDGTLFGYAFTSFALSPDGRTLWAMPQLKSPIMLMMQLGLDPTNRTEINRYMALPIDLTGAQPRLDPAYAGDDIDGYQGEAGSRGYVTPAADPGVDINLAGYSVYQRRLLPSTASFQPASIPFAPTLAVTNDSLWVRGSGNAAAGASGLGKAGDLAVYDLATRQMILFPYDDAGFYRFWHGGADPEPRMGFDLAPESSDSVATFGLRFVPGS